MPNSPALGTWTEKLAALLLGNGPADQQDAALKHLASSLAIGDPAAEQTRRTILQLMASRAALLDGTAGAGASTTLPKPWPIEPMDPLPPLSADAVAGTCIIAAVREAHADLPAVLASWAATGVDEVILVDAQPIASLARDLRTRGVRLPNLRIVHAGAALTDVEALNVGLQVSHFSRIVILNDRVGLRPDHFTTPLLPHSFLGLAEDQAAGLAAMDLWRCDVAAANGLNSFLTTASWALADLAARLTSIGLRHGGLATGHRWPVVPLVERMKCPDTLTLRDYLLAHPAFAALQDRAVSALMPDWTDQPPRNYAFAGQDTEGLHLIPDPSPLPPTTPPHILTTARKAALTDMIRATLGSRPEALETLEPILSLAANSASGLDIEVALGPHAALVGLRKGWLVVDVPTPADLPAPGTDAARALATLEKLAQRMGQTVVLRSDLELPPTPHPSVPARADANLFWPADLREMVLSDGTRKPRHSAVYFDQRTIDDLNRVAVEGPAILRRKPKLFIDAQHGLGNRMRSIASAAAIAKATDRELIIIWQSDDHCACQFDDLFAPAGCILTDGFVQEAATMGMDVFNYMQVEPGGAKDAPVHLSAMRDAYLRSAYPFVSPCSNWASENEMLAKLRPNEVVLDLVASVRSPNALSVHIRMEGGTTAEHLPYESRENWTEADHLEIDRWRKRSHFSHFLPRIDTLIAEGQADTIYLAADTPWVYDEFERRYGKRLAWLPRRVADRSAQAIAYALADAILLGRSQRILGSNWSSFTELALRLSPSLTNKVELSGQDF